MLETGIHRPQDLRRMGRVGSLFLHHLAEIQVDEHGYHKTAESDDLTRIIADHSQIFLEGFAHGLISWKVRSEQREERP